MTASTFARTVVAGLIATFVMTMTGFWQAGAGLPPVDVGAMLAGSMTRAHPEMGYGLVAGNLVHFANGAILALIWVAFLQARVPGNWLVHGIVYAILTTLAAALVVVPLAAGAGILFRNTPMPGPMVLASSIVHLGYGLTLALSLEVAGVRGGGFVGARPSARTGVPVAAD